MDKKLDELSEEEFLNIMKFHSEAVTEVYYMISLLIILLLDLNTMHYLIIILKEL